MTFDELLAEHASGVYKLARAIRKTIQEVMPDAEERVYPGWHGAGYHHPAAGYVCAIFPKSDVVEVAFEHGSSLPDPDGLLTRGGKQVRYAIFSDWLEQDADSLAALIERAILMRT